jgi:cation diffusion facilitator CzcD-associated flavoprotein CzcO
MACTTPVVVHWLRVESRTTNVCHHADRCACDVPAHAYGFSWEGNPRWSQAYVTALELFDYFKGRAKEYGVFDYVHLSHRVTKCEWNEKQGKWEVEVEDLEAGRMLTDEAEVVVNATGFLK